jgi:hypothetical protein
MKHSQFATGHTSALVDDDGLLRVGHFKSTPLYEVPAYVLAGLCIWGTGLARESQEELDRRVAQQCTEDGDDGRK